jgi:hypothetical protein
MVQGGTPAVGSMGDDTALAALANQPRSLFAFVRQGFAEVTNPPIDPLRERDTMSLDTLVGPRPRILARDGEADVALRLRSPVLTDAGMRKLRDVARQRGVELRDVPTLVTIGDAGYTDDAVRTAVDTLCVAAATAARDGVDVIVLTDRAAAPERHAGAPGHERMVVDRRRAHPPGRTRPAMDRRRGRGRHTAPQPGVLQVQA